eukprot:scaffold451_cov365-Prasinococcus_capsulatus_cf.AAC.14
MGGHEDWPTLAWRFGRGRRRSATLSAMPGLLQMPRLLGGKQGRRVVRARRHACTAPACRPAAAQQAVVAPRSCSCATSATQYEAEELGGGRGQSIGDGGAMDAEYLRNTVGDALAQGCAAAVQARPSDPVAFLSKWLHQHVRAHGKEEVSSAAAASCAATGAGGRPCCSAGPLTMRDLLLATGTFAFCRQEGQAPARPRSSQRGLQRHRDDHTAHPRTGCRMPAAGVRCITGTVVPVASSKERTPSWHHSLLAPACRAAAPMRASPWERVSRRSLASTAAAGLVTARRRGQQVYPAGDARQA